MAAELSAKYFYELTMWNQAAGAGKAIPKYIVCEDAAHNFYVLDITLKAHSEVDPCYNKWRALLENPSSESALSIINIWFVGDTQSYTIRDADEVALMFAGTAGLPDPDDTIVLSSDELGSEIFGVAADGVKVIYWEFDYSEGA